MRLHAYVLAADPTWIEVSVPAYYDQVDTILVSYDAEHRGWTGAPVDVTRCLDGLRSIDHDRRMRFVPGRYSRVAADPLECETVQRQACLDALSDADWVLQLDTDELLPDPSLLEEILDSAESHGCAAVEWPMRVLFRRLPSGRFLQVVKSDGSTHFEYPGPIAIRTGTSLKTARRTAAPVLRVVVKGDQNSIDNATGPIHEIAEADAIWHNSWARSPRSVWSKVRSWGHNDGWHTYRYFAGTWLPSPLLWRWQRGLHPFGWGDWDRLSPAVRSSKFPEGIA